MSKNIHHLDTLMIKALIHLKIITEVIQSHLASEINVTLTQRTHYIAMTFTSLLRKELKSLNDDFYYKLVIFISN